MPALFGFLQFEFPWALGPADGRYVLRARPVSEPERIVVLSTLGAPQRHRTVTRRTLRAVASGEPAAVATARATVIDPVPLPAEAQARAWLAKLDGYASADAAVAVVNRVLFAHRIASADPYVHEVSAHQALIVRAGWGEGEQVADGRWREALELSLYRPRRARRVSVLRPQERLAVLLGARGEALLTEELALRARLDLDQGRPRHAAVALRDAFAAAASELASEQRADMRERLAELDGLRAGVETMAHSVLAADPEPHHEPDVELLAHALERLQAALRARTAAGF